MYRFVLTLLAFAAIVRPVDSQEPPKFAFPAVIQKKDFSNHGRGYKPLTPERRAFFQKISHEKHGGRLAMMAANQALPPAFDCRTKNPLPVWDQGQCGSCYLVSTVRTATCTLINGGYGKADGSFMLAAQFGMDRPRDFGGCDGGNGTEVIDWMVKNGWPAEIYVDQQGTTHKDYPPYQASTGSDRTKPGAKMWMKGADWGFVNANGHPTTVEIKTALFNYGRLNISLDAGGQFMNIGSGTITSLGNNIDHEINMAGYDDAKGAFLLENQWNTDWGNGGYAWVTYAAAAHIVDIFFVTASPLPPPPPPPPPPPGPGGDTITITTSIGGKVMSTTYPIGGGKKINDEVPQKVIDALNEAFPPKKMSWLTDEAAERIIREAMAENWPRFEARLADLEKRIEAKYANLP